MQRNPWGLLVLGFWVALMLALSDAPAGAQDKKSGKDGKVGKGDKDLAPKAVEILTIDGVELRGKFYPSARGKDAPVAMLLHALGDGENSSTKEWINLAKKLQERGYAVLTFDFRGHGDSTTVRPGMPNKNPMLAMPGFWDEQLNWAATKNFSTSKPRPTEIKVKEFQPSYYTVLCNDIAAAKAWLDERNDDGVCNSGNMVLIGAKDAGLLGALWLNSEWQRYRFLPPGPGLPQGSIDRKNPEGQCVTAAVWLTMTDNFAKQKSHYKVGSMLEIPAKGYKVPMLFLYGEGDDTGKKVATTTETFIRGKTGGKDYPFTAAMKVAKADGVAGRELLVEPLDGTKQIVEFLDGAVGDKKIPVKMRSKSEDVFVWYFTNSKGQPQQIVAKQKGNTQVEFAGYASFLR
jgi:hypothetical protein